MLIIVQGDISISHHFFNLGKDISWQISRIKCWNDDLKMLTEVQKPQLVGSLMGPPPLFVVSFSGVDDPKSPLIQPARDGTVLSFCSDSINFLLEADRDALTAKFKLFHDGTIIKEVTSCFEDYQVSPL